MMKQYKKHFIAAVMAVMLVLNVHGQPLADGLPKFLGCAYSNTQATNFTKYWNQVTPENGGKWGTAEPARDVMNRTELNAAYSVANANGFVLKEHTLIWGNQAPSWMETLDSASQIEEIKEWFHWVDSVYPGIQYIDVVNEPLHAPPTGTGHGNYMNALGGSGTTGWDWIITAFKLARQYFPNAKLLINEYSVTNSTASAQSYVNIINLLKVDNLIDGIGIQAHAFSTYGVSADVTRSNLDLIASTGLPIYISELDIDGFTDLEQLREYARVFPVFWEHPAVQGITLWGFRYGLWRTSQGAYLVTQTGAERPAFKWLKAYVKGTLVTSDSVEVSSADVNDTIFIDETLQMNAQVYPLNTTIPTVTWSVWPTAAATINSQGLLTPLKTGKVTVKATAWDTGKIGSQFITIVARPVETISLTAQKDTITLQETLQISVSVQPETATNSSVTWSVIPAGIATISQTGLLTPVTAGNVIVVARSNDGSLVTDSLEIAIEDPTPVEKEQTFAGISVYPNPVLNGIISITGAGAITAIDVLNMNGKIITSVPCTGANTYEINLGDQKGVFVIRFKKGNIQTTRTIVSR